jgi:hypothetical protein
MSNKAKQRMVIDDATSESYITVSLLAFLPFEFRHQDP